jgi:hypothetical protein
MNPRLNLQKGSASTDDDSNFKIKFKKRKEKRCILFLHRYIHPPQTNTINFPEYLIFMPIYLNKSILIE